MKFIHTADWHLGKIVHGVSMIEDQRFVLKKLIKIIEIEKPDALVIAGDLYDRSVPPASAINLLNQVLFTINVEMNVPVIAISGNHDSADRLAFGSTWFRQSHFYLAGKLEKEMYCPVINGVHFHCLPYAEPGVVRHLYEDESIQSHHDAMKVLTGRLSEQMDPNAFHVAVGHSFVTGGETSDSERILSVGGTGNVGAELFSPFHYTALGHLHNPNAIRHEKVQYSGSLLKYSFSEASHTKSISIIELDEKGQLSVTQEPLTPLRDMKEIKGFFDEIMEMDEVDDYIKVTLKDEGAILDPMAKLKMKFPNILHLERAALKAGSTISAAELKKQKNELELFGEFYEVMTGLSFSAEKEAYIASVMDDVKKGREYA
ncbi:exonuclease SbcCD subunit D [Domibacillus epiphyticus]|uniref:Nuclease SbcCD subunit D n=1 Tax=Domibacillus epiphyticus TaxID=1714355 RepID=A0A1V2A7C3_9BACI|nr:exonuclease SbcCD subunit D [Domibacillus epiphyticus]OMP66899.1 exonuclease sbcCD subunit D [Domibacillus epiphyticus]